MTSGNDANLLEAFAATRDQQAFASLVNRYIQLVYGCARRQVGDAHLAEDATQAVFILLARRARSIDAATLPGWLVRTTRFVARDLLKQERRRRARERSAGKAMEMNAACSDTSSEWKEIAPVLDDGLARLSEPDRTAVVLRFLQE